MIIQIYTAQSVDEALALADAGVDHVGVTPPQGLPGEVSLATMRDIALALKGRARCVALTVDITPETVAELVTTVQPDILHLCPLADAIKPADIPPLRAVLPPGMTILQAISVTGPESIAEAQAYAAVADMLILDTQHPDIRGVGASGMVHDWSISQAIVQAVAVPVIMAGGLSPENVAEAVRVVRPWGVDSATLTNEALADGSVRKDLAKVRAFAAAARAAVEAL
ncbi:MAG: phosphoribosylanthranilate isomerase [Anaerolineae bacterium]|nr:phosphoribosylanthranilate isomerase [Anaerolineae bacterium]